MNNLEAKDAYESMTPKTRKQVMLAEYRCRAKGCLLLHVWQAPDGRYWYKPSYTLSREVNEAQSVPSARQKGTSDGNRKWLARAGSIDNELAFLASDDGLGMDLACDHIRGVLPGKALAEVIDAAQPGAPTKPIFLSDDTPQSVAVVL